LDHEKQYTDEELDAFEKQYEELRRQQEEVCLSHLYGATLHRAQV